MQTYEHVVDGTGILGLFKRRDRFYEFSDLADMEATGSGLTKHYLVGRHYEGGFVRGLKIERKLERGVDTALLELSDEEGRTILVHTGRTWPPGEGNGLMGPLFESPTQGYETSLNAVEGDPVDIGFPLLELKRYFSGDTSSLHLDGVWTPEKNPYFPEERFSWAR